MDGPERHGESVEPSVLEALWLNANQGMSAAAAFLRELSRQQVIALLQQPPGPGQASPERNLVQWQRQADGLTFVPIFTAPRQLSVAPPPPVRVVRVSMRTLLAAGGNRPYIVNPTSPSAFELREAQLDFLRRCVADAHHDAEHPSLHNPWVFQLPDDALYPVAVKLVEWFNSHDRVDEAFLYELTRGGQSQIVLGLNEEVDQALADTLIDVAVRAGVSAASFVVRFLPDEPSHREGVALGGITPFYRRPASSLN